jgi:hypothetical protein
MSAEILKAFHHPYYADSQCQMHVAMEQACKKWVDGLGNDQRETLRRLTKVINAFLPFLIPDLHSSTYVWMQI